MATPIVSSWDDPVPEVSSWEDEKPAPTQQTLAERQEKRAQLERRAEQLALQVQQLEEVMVSLPQEQQADFADTIKKLREQQKVLKAEIAKTGVGTTGRNVGSFAGAVLGGGLGGAAGSVLGPKGTLAGGVAGSAAGTAVGSALGTKYDLARAEPVTEEEASDLIKSNVIEDVIWDVGGNVVMIGAGRVLKLALKPGVKERLMRQLEAEKIASRVNIADKQRTAAVDEMFNLKSRVPGVEAGEEALQAQARVKAVAELSKRSRGWIPTPGQITGKAGVLEKTARSLRADDFTPASDALETSAKSMRMEQVAPRGNPSREQLGLLVQKQAESVENAVKNKHRKTFQAAKEAGVEVKMDQVAKRIEQELAADAGSGGSVFNGTERSRLQNVLDRLRPDAADADGNIVEILGPNGGAARQALEEAGEEVALPWKTFSAEDAVNFMSGNKRLARNITAEGKPSEGYVTLLGDLNKMTDQSFDIALSTSGKKGLANALDVARGEYRNMMGAIYDSAVTDALKRNPEDVGRLFWQNGNVTEIKQLQNLLEMGLKEKTLTKDQVKGINEAVVRGFLSDGVPNVQAAAKWSDALKSDVKKRETWQTLIAQPGMGELDQGMRVLEEAAKIALTKNADLSYSGSGMISNVGARVIIGVALGFMGPKAVALFVTAEVWARMMATALARGDKGAFMTMQAVLRASTRAEGKAGSALRPAVTKLIQWAQDNGFGDEITTDEPQMEEVQ